jgi:hypothetical protein
MNKSIEVSNKAIEVIKLVTNAVSSSLTGVTFCSIDEYNNQQGEKAKYLINVGINYEKSKQADIVFLENLKASEHTFKSSVELIEEARIALIQAFIKPNENRSNGQKDAYTTIFSGVKVHNETGKVYVYGYKVTKTIIEKGEYKADTRGALTIAKDELRKLLKTGQFVNLSLEVGNTIKANKETLEL